MGKIRINREGKIKASLSLLLFFYAFLIGIWSNNITIIFAMFFSAVGDMLLLLNRGCFNEEKKETFNYGILAFSMSHLAYMYAMMIGLFSNILICIVWVIIVALSILIKSKYKSRTVIFSLYGIIILLNFVNSFNFSIIATTGMFLFILSDITVAMSKIRQKRTMLSQIIIWTTYILAQGCVLTSFLL